MMADISVSRYRSRRYRKVLWPALIDAVNGVVPIAVPSRKIVAPGGFELNPTRLGSLVNSKRNVWLRFEPTAIGRFKGK